MPKVSKKEAQEWMNKIDGEDKVAIILDDDPDGFCSGILFLDFCKKRGAKVKEFIYSKGKTPFEDLGLESFNKVIITDIAPGLLDENLKKIKDKDVLYMDHHPRDIPSPKEINEYTTLERGYIPSSRSAFELTGGKRWIALVGTISDAAHLYSENDEFIKKSLEEIGMDLEEFKKEITFTISNFLIYFEDKRKKSFNILKDFESVKDISSIKKYSDKIKGEINKFVKNFEKNKEMIGEVNFYQIESKYKVKGSVAFEIGTKKENFDKIFIFVGSSSGGKTTLSARNSSKKRDMADLLKAGIKDLEGGAGGHKAAAGGKINSKDLQKFKENLREYLENNSPQ